MCSDSLNYEVNLSVSDKKSIASHALHILLFHGMQMGCSTEGITEVATIVKVGWREGCQA